MPLPSAAPVSSHSLPVSDSDTKTARAPPAAVTARPLGLLRLRAHVASVPFGCATRTAQLLRSAMKTRWPTTARARGPLRRETPSGPSALPEVACPAAVPTVHCERSLAATRRRRALPALRYTVVPAEGALAADSLTAMPLSAAKEAASPGPPSPALKVLPLPASVEILAPLRSGSTRTRQFWVSAISTALPARATAHELPCAKKNCACASGPSRKPSAPLAAQVLKTIFLPSGLHEGWASVKSLEVRRLGVPPG